MFTATERAEHRATEAPLIGRARQGDAQPLFQFWREKRVVWQQRCFERFIASPTTTKETHNA